MNELFAAACGLIAGIAIMLLVCISRKPKDAQADAARIDWIESREPTVLFNEQYGWGVMSDGKLVTHSETLRKSIDQARRVVR